MNDEKSGLRHKHMISDKISTVGCSCRQIKGEKMEIIDGFRSVTHYNSVFQPGFRGTQIFRQILAGFPENAINSTIWSV